MSDRIRIEKLEARLEALIYVTVAIALAAIFNLGVSIWSLQTTDSPDWNAVAVSLTVLEIFLAIIAVGGFWILRGAAQKAAAEAAGQVAEESAQRELREVLGPMVRREVLSYLRARDEEKSYSDKAGDDIFDLMQALDAEGET